MNEHVEEKLASTKCSFTSGAPTSAPSKSTWTTAGSLKICDKSKLDNNMNEGADEVNVNATAGAASATAATGVNIFGGTGQYEHEQRAKSTITISGNTHQSASDR